MENNKNIEEKKEEKKKLAFSKKLMVQESILIWITTLSLIALAYICVFKGYFGELPWIASMIGFPWAAYGTSQAFHLGKSKTENSVGGIVYETAMKQLEMQQQLLAQTKDEEASG